MLAHPVELMYDIYNELHPTELFFHWRLFLLLTLAHVQAGTKQVLQILLLLLALLRFDWSSSGSSRLYREERKEMIEIWQ